MTTTSVSNAPSPSSPNSSPRPMNHLLVGSQLLGNRPTKVAGDDDGDDDDGNRNTSNSTVPSWDTFEPIVTPEITYVEGKQKQHHRRKPERFILLPHAKHIDVLVYKTGIKIATLTPAMDRSEDDNDESIIIECVSLVNYQRKHKSGTEQQNIDMLTMMDVEVDADTEKEELENDDKNDTQMNSNGAVDETLVLVGCQDGSVREFSLQVLGNRGGGDKTVHFGTYKVSGPCFRPRRRIQVLPRKDPIMHMTVPHLTLTQVRDDGILMYVAVRQRRSSPELRTENDKKKKMTTTMTRQKLDDKSPPSFTIEVLRCMVPYFDDGYGTDINLHGSLVRSLDKFKCKIRKRNNQNLPTATTLPFQMISAANDLPNGGNSRSMVQQQNNCSIFVVLARTNAITVYYDQPNSNSTQTFPPMAFSMPPNNPLTAVGISLNKVDIACGHYKGNISVMSSILSDIEIYHLSMKKLEQLNGGSTPLVNCTSSLPRDPRKNMITVRVHWHALPVTSIVYDSMSYKMDPLLYSGGDESVLVTWQISQGRDGPVDVHPRLALGGIVHLTSSDRCDDNPANGVLVYCDDNTMQLLESHNKRCVWKIQGLACGKIDRDTITMPLRGTSLQIDPRSDGQKNSHIVITGLDQAPGYIHWFDPKRQRRASSLEVVPFNRISRTEADERELPKPTITGHVFSKNGEDLITIDESQTENLFVGACEEEQNKHRQYGSVNTIRFWSWNDSSPSSHGGEGASPYYQVASMTYPHGPKSHISAVGMSSDGTVACTVSNDEKAFRVWEKDLSPYRIEDAGKDEMASWACRYKVTIPAGFSNCTTKKYGVTFSDDNSLLAIAFGKNVTIWETDGARLLTTFDHSQGNFDIELVQFLSPGLHQDLLLIQSKTCVSVRSLYGPSGNSGNFQSWSWFIPLKSSRSLVTAVVSVESQDCIAVAVFFPDHNRSRTFLIDVPSGKEKSSLGAMQQINGYICALCAVGKQRVKSNWDSSNDKTTAKSSFGLYALTSDGDLLLLTADETMYNYSMTSVAEENKSLMSTGPKLNIASFNDHENRNKRQRTRSSFYPSYRESSKAKKSALEIFGFGVNDDMEGYPSTSDLPSLSTNFVKTFVGRNLLKTR